MKRLLTAVAAALLAALAVPAPAAAHAGLALAVNDDGRGNVSVDVSWADGHPVTEAMAGTMLAVSGAGTQVGPAPLTRLPGRSTLLYGGTLAPGTWQVTIDVALPGIGHCAAPVTVAPSGAKAQARTTRCAAPPSPTAAGRAAAPPGPAAGSGDAAWPAWLTVVLVALGAALIAGTAVALRGRAARRR